MAEREGTRKSSVPIVVCTAPDFCKTPVGNSTPPIPYQIIANFQDSDAVSPNVRFGGNPAFLLDQSIIARVTGDEPGTAGGVRSGVNKSIAKPIEASTTVRANKKRAVRDNDAFEMNQGNTNGVCIYQTGSRPACKIGADGRPTGNTNPAIQSNTPAEMEAAKEGKGMWSKASPIVHGVLGAAGFVPGLSAVTGAFDAGIHAFEGNFDEAIIAGSAMMPGGKIVTTAGKLAKGAITAGKVAKTAKVTKEGELAVKAVAAKKSAEIAGKTGNAVTDGVRITKKKPTVSTNKEKGDAFAKRKTEEFKKTADNVENEITVKTKDGTRTRLDAVGLDKETGGIRIQEYKSSDTAPFTPGQKKAFPQIESDGADIVGKGKGRFSGGSNIPPTKIEIIRP